MKTYNAADISNYILEFVYKNAEKRILEKQLTFNKLTPFLFHQTVKMSLAQNISVMDKNNFLQSPPNLRNNQEPDRMKKDNLNPKSVNLTNPLHLLQKYSILKLKNSKSPKKRSFTAFQTSRQKRSDNSPINRSRPMTSNQIEKPNCWGHKVQKSQRNSRAQINSQILQVASTQRQMFSQNNFNSKRPISTQYTKFGKKKKEFVKLNLESQNVPDDFLKDIEHQHRSKILKHQEQNEKNNKIQTLMSHRLLRLKEKFKEQEENGEMISFDFDGSIINLDDQFQSSNQILHKNSKIQWNQQIDNLNQLEKKHYHSTLKVKSLVKKSFPFSRQNNQNPLFIQTLYKIPQNSLDQRFKISNDRLKNNKIEEAKTYHQKSLNKQQSHSKNQYLQPQINHKQQNISRQTSIRSNQTQLDKPEQIPQNLKQRNVKIESNSSSFERPFQKRKVQKQILEKNSIDFSNNYQRQTSTIPYLELHQGIKYQQEISSTVGKNDGYTDLRFITIQKQKNQQSRTNHEPRNNLNGNQTFRSYLPSSKSIVNTINNLNQTFSVFQLDEKSKSNFDNKKLPCKSQRQRIKAPIQDEDDLFLQQLNQKYKNNKNLLQKSHLNRPKTTSYTLQIYSNQKQKTNKNEIKQIKDNRSQNIMDLKQKLMLRQKQNVISADVRSNR